MYLDDNHNSVVLACARAILCALTFEINEELFEIVEVRLVNFIASLNCALGDSLFLTSMFLSEDTNSSEGGTYCSCF